MKFSIRIAFDKEQERVDVRSNPTENSSLLSRAHAKVKNLVERMGGDVNKPIERELDEELEEELNRDLAFYIADFEQELERILEETENYNEDFSIPRTRPSSCGNFTMDSQPKLQIKRTANRLHFAILTKLGEHICQKERVIDDYGKEHSKYQNSSLNTKKTQNESILNNVEITVTSLANLDITET